MLQNSVLEQDSGQQHAQRSIQSLTEWILLVEWNLIFLFNGLMPILLCLDHDKSVHYIVQLCC